MKKKNLVVFAITAFILAVIIFGAFLIFSSKSNGGIFRTATDKGITIDKDVHDFGVIKENGESVSAIFVVANHTKEPILLVNVIASCGCTVPTWTKEPILSGHTGMVTATFNPKNHPGTFDKSITIITNGQPQRIIAHIKGTVE